MTVPGARDSLISSSTRTSTTASTRTHCQTYHILEYVCYICRSFPAREAEKKTARKIFLTSPNCLLADVVEIDSSVKGLPTAKGF